jgi:hypothetical protein
MPIQAGPSLEGPTDVNFHNPSEPKWLAAYLPAAGPK